MKPCRDQGRAADTLLTSNCNYTQWPDLSQRRTWPWLHRRFLEFHRGTPFGMYQSHLTWLWVYPLTHVGSTYGKDEKNIQNMKGRDHAEDLRVDGRIILEWILRN